MSFLHPWGLAIASLAAIPIILHLFRHRTRQRVEFPALRYLHRTLREQARTVRVRDLVLLVLRVSALLLLALAAAAPLAGRGDAGDHEPTDVALVIDNSASTSLVSGDRTVFQESIEWARASIETAGPEDRFWIFAAVGGPVAIAAARGEAAAALDRVGQTHGAGDMLETIRNAALGVPAEPGRAREIQVLTDGQATGYEGEPVAAAGIPMVVGLVVAGASGNDALVEAELVPGAVVTTGVAPELTARVRRFPAPGEPSGEATGADSARIRLEVNGETLDIAATAWDGDAVFRLGAGAPGLLGGRVEIEPDGLRVDDARHFAIRVLRAPNVERVISPYGFLARALDALEQAGRVGGGGRTLVVYEADSGQPLDPLPERTSVLLLVPPSDALALPRFNQYLAALSSGWHMAVETASGSIGFEDGSRTPGLESVAVSVRYGLEAAGGGIAPGTAGGDTVLIRTADGRPWLVRGERDGRVLLLLASPLTPAATTLPVSPAMIPFVEAVALRWSRGESWPGRAFIAGAAVSLPPDADSVRLADGSVRRVDGGAPFTPELAGLYTVYRGDADSALFAANPPASESDLGRIDPADLESLLGGPVAAAEDPDAWRDAIFASRRGRDLTLWFIAAAVTLLVAEIFLASPSRRARGS